MYGRIAQVALETLVARKHDTIFFYVKSDKHTFELPREESRDLKRFNKTDSDGRRYYIKAGNTYYADKGVAVRDVWEIAPVRNVSREYQGWTTQKPVPLYTRIVTASTNKGDMVLDPFCGCATTCVAAEQSDRHWVGIDQSPKAKTIVKHRLASEVQKSLAWNERVTVAMSPPKRTDLRELLPPMLSLPPAIETRGRRKRKKTNAPSYDRNEMRVRLALRDGPYCQGCGMLPPTMPGSLSPELEYLDIDHIVPRADAGSDFEKNLCLLCPPCNRRKAHIWTLAQLRQANQRTKKMLDRSQLKKELEIE